VGVRSTRIQFVSLSVAILLLVVLHRLVLLDWMLQRPFLASGIVLVLVFLGALAVGTLDAFTLIRLVVSPLATLVRYRGSIAIGFLLVVGSAVALELHPWISEWPGTILVCVTFAYLIRSAHAPRSVFHIVSGVANNVQIWNARQLDLLYRFFRGGERRFDQLLREFVQIGRHPLTSAQSRAITEEWDRVDHARQDTPFNVIGWFIAWQCLLLVVHSGNLFRVFHLQHEQAFAFVEGGGLDPDHAWAWLLFGLDRLLLESELTFDVYDIYGIEDHGLWGLQAIRHATAVSHVLFLLHITISVLLANTIFHHFAFGRHVKRLLRTVRLHRYQERMANRAYRSLRVLRPLVERRLIRVLRSVLARDRSTRGSEGGWRRAWTDLRAQSQDTSDLDWTDVMGVVSLVRSPAARDALSAVVRNTHAPFQVRLAALCSLLASTVEQRRIRKIPAADIVSVLEPIAGCCDGVSSIRSFETHAWLDREGQTDDAFDGRVLSESRVVRLVCEDLLTALDRADAAVVDVL